MHIHPSGYSNPIPPTPSLAAFFLLLTLPKHGLDFAVDQHASLGLLFIRPLLMIALLCGPDPGFAICAFQAVLRMVMLLSQQLDKHFYLSPFPCSSFIVSGRFNVTLPSHQAGE